MREGGRAHSSEGQWAAFPRRPFESKHLLKFIYRLPERVLVILLQKPSVLALVQFWKAEMFDSFVLFWECAVLVGIK